MNKLEGYLVVLARVDDASAPALPENTSLINPRYRGIFRLPPYPSEVAEEESAMDDYVFGEYVDRDGLVSDLGLARELLHRFSRSLRKFELIYVRAHGQDVLPPSPLRLCFLGFDVAVWNPPFWSVVWDWLPKHDEYLHLLNASGLFDREEDARTYLAAYETECPPDPRPNLLVWEVYLASPIGGNR